MKAEEIAGRFTRSLEKFGDLRVRVLKLNALCNRSGVEVSTVVRLLPEDVQARIRDQRWD